MRTYGRDFCPLLCRGLLKRHYCGDEVRSYGDAYSRGPKPRTLLAAGSGECLREASRLRFTSGLTGTAFATTKGERLRENLVLRSKVRTCGGCSLAYSTANQPLIPAKTRQPSQFDPTDVQERLSSMVCPATRARQVSIKRCFESLFDGTSSSMNPGEGQNLSPGMDHPA